MEKQDYEKEDDYDLEDIAKMLREDLAHRWPGHRCIVKLRRHQKRNHEIVITVDRPYLEKMAYLMAKDYITSAWHDGLQCFKPNFIPIVITRARE